MKLVSKKTTAIIPKIIAIVPEMIWRKYNTAIIIANRTLKDLSMVPMFFFIFIIGFY